MNRAFSYEVNRVFSHEVNRAFSYEVNGAFSYEVNEASFNSFQFINILANLFGISFFLCIFAAKFGFRN